MTGVDQILIQYPKTKKVAFFHSHVLWPSHFETELEMMQLLSEKNIKTVSLVCNGILKVCDQNPAGDKNKCVECILKRERGLELLEMPSEKTSIKIRRHSSKISPNSNLDEIKRIVYENFDVGFATLSTVVSIFRDPYVSLEKNHKLFKTIFETSIALYEYFVNFFNRIKPDIVLIFNGRFAYTRAMVRACERLKIPYYTHERGSNFKNYMIYPNVLPHDIDYFNHNMVLTWDNALVNKDQKMNIADKFYIDSMKGRALSWVSFTDKQDKEKIPENWNADKHNIGIFLSSEDEFVSIGDQWDKGLFLNQINGLDFILNKSFTNNDFHYYIRIHPNSQKLTAFVELVKRYQNDNITVIPPESPISTYKLLMNVDKVITFGSTVGIEATYWGKPSINLGNYCFYKTLQVTYNPETVDEAMELIIDKMLSPKEKQNTLVYAYYFSVFGYEFKYYTPFDLFNGTYKGINLKLNDQMHIPFKYRLINLFGNRIYSALNYSWVLLYLKLPQWWPFKSKLIED